MRSSLTFVSPAVGAFALALSLFVGAPAFAQAPGASDLRALIYYLDHDDHRSVQAEMRRLRAQFPGWAPPGDLNTLRLQVQTPGAGADVAPIWARIERGDHAGARALIDQTRRTVPGWAPDAEMTRVLELNEGQAAFDLAVSRRDTAAAVSAARRTPALMRCDRINNAWQLADLYRYSGERDLAVQTYRGVLGSCTRSQDAVPTLEKANDVATAAQMEELFTLARSTAPANRATLDQLEARLRAGRGGAVAPVAQAQAPAPAPAAPATARAPAAVQPPAQPPVQAPAPGASAPATALAPTSLPLRGDNRVARVRSLKEAGDWPSCLAQSDHPRSLDVLYERSWCAFSYNRAGEALVGFNAVARNGAGLGGTVQRDALYGMTLSYLHFNMTEEAAGIAARANLSQPQRIEVEAVILDQRGVRSYHARDYAQAIAYFDALERMTGSLRRDLAMLRAYAHIQLGNFDIARDQFTVLHNQLATRETRAALAGLAERG